MDLEINLSSSIGQCTPMQLPNPENTVPQVEMIQIKNGKPVLDERYFEFGTQRTVFDPISAYYSYNTPEFIPVHASACIARDLGMEQIHPERRSNVLEGLYRSVPQGLYRVDEEDASVEKQMETLTMSKNVPVHATPINGYNVNCSSASMERPWTTVSGHGMTKTQHKAECRALELRVAKTVVLHPHLLGRMAEYVRTLETADQEAFLADLYKVLPEARKLSENISQLVSLLRQACIGRPELQPLVDALEWGRIIRNALKGRRRTKGDWTKGECSLRSILSGEIETSFQRHESHMQRHGISTARPFAREYQERRIKRDRLRQRIVARSQQLQAERDESALMNRLVRMSLNSDMNPTAHTNTTLTMRASEVRPAPCFWTPSVAPRCFGPGFQVSSGPQSQQGGYFTASR